MSRLHAVTMLALAIATVAPALAQPARMDMRKSAIETPIKGLLPMYTLPLAEQPRVDFRKDSIESPVKSLIPEPSSAVPKAGFVNPRVQPGLVTWHADYSSACRAASASGKPVLLFQMMGKLDQKFC